MPLLVPLHGIASRHDLPLPFSFVLVGAGVALVVSFLLLAFAWRTPRWVTYRPRPLPRATAVLDAPGTRLVARLIILAGYAWVGLALMAGRDRLTNPVFGFVYVWVWVGLIPVSLLFGQIWRATNPLRTLHRGLCALARTDPGVGVIALPARVGRWPAAVGVLAYAWLELVQPDRATLSVLRIWVLVWLIVLILGAVVFGEAWIGAADPFEAYASTVAELSCWRRTDGQLSWGQPLAGLTAWAAPPGSVGVMAALLGSTAFDSLQNSSWWLQHAQASTWPIVVWPTAGLLIVVGIIGATFCAAAAGMARYGDRPASHYPGLMVGSLVPIIIGYAIAHYATLLITEGQRTAVGLSDPLGHGWDVFGTAGWGANLAIFNHPTGIALIQLVAIVAGHIVGIVCAHELAVRLLPASRAVRGQLPMLIVMVGYTVTGLVLLFSP